MIKYVLSNLPSSLSARTMAACASSTESSDWQRRRASSSMSSASAAVSGGCLATSSWKEGCVWL
jgi:hypothetical protein